MTTTLDIAGINDFRVCSLYYKYKHIDLEPERILQRDIMADRFENTLKRVASFFFYKQQGGTIPSYNSLLNRWEKLWFPKGTDLFDLTVEQHETVHGNLASYTRVAAATLLQFHEDFAEEAAIPVLIDEQFLIPLGSDLRLKGVLDLVVRTGDQYRVIKWVGRQKRPSLAALAFDFAAARMAFEYRNIDAPKSTRYALYDLGSTHPGMIPVSPTTDDLNALLFWANEMHDTELFYPRRGLTVYCRGCQYDLNCSKFVFPSPEV